MNRTSYPSDLTDAAVGETVIVSANTSPLRQTSQVGDVFNHQRHLLCRQVRLPMANATP